MIAINTIAKIDRTITHIIIILITIMLAALRSVRS